MLPSITAMMLLRSVDSAYPSWDSSPILLATNNWEQEYRFGTTKYPHGFCPNCGTSVYARAEGREYDGIMAVNVSLPGIIILVFPQLIGEQGRTLKDVDISTLKIEQLHGEKVNAG
jgi:Uncharacterized conserved protein